MYFFYFDESGSRDPSTGMMEKPKDHLYVLLAVGMYEGQWHRFETAISGLKRELTDYLKRDGKGRFELADCEVKSNWVRVSTNREKRSPFLHALHQDDMTRLTDTYFRQVAERNMVIMCSVIDKRFLHDHITHETLHMRAYEFLLERIQHYMREYHPKHRALIVMDDTSRQLNRAIAMKHASFQRAGNRNMTFPAIVEYPFLPAVNCRTASSSPICWPTTSIAFSSSEISATRTSRERCRTSIDGETGRPSMG